MRLFILTALAVLFSCASTKQRIEYISRYTNKASEKNTYVKQLEAQKIKYWVIKHRDTWEIESEVIIKEDRK